MTKNGKRSGKRAPTPAKSGDTLDNLPTFNLSRDLYESERKEIYTGILLRLTELKSVRKKVTDALGIPAEQEKDVSRVIALYEGDTGILALFQNSGEEEEYTAAEVKKGGKDHRQRDIPFSAVPSESTPETRASTEPVGVNAIDSLVSAIAPHAPSDMDWDAFRRHVVEMSSDERTQVHEYAERRHQFDNFPRAAVDSLPFVPAFLHSLFVDLSPAYAQALGGREDVLYKTDMERAMARAAAKKKADSDAAPDVETLTGKQLAALEAIAAGHAGTVAASMYRKVTGMGLVVVNMNQEVVLTGRGKQALATGVVPALPKTAVVPPPVVTAEPPPEGQTPPQGDAQEAAIAVEGNAGTVAPVDLSTPALDAWEKDHVRTEGEEPVASLTAIAQQESK